jgi:formate-dependent nitrite reductase membrane component NrfD
MPELVAIWLSGLVLLLVLFGLIAALLRYTSSGRAQRMPLSDVFKVLAVTIGLVCAAYTALTLVS